MENKQLFETLKAGLGNGLVMYGASDIWTLQGINNGLMPQVEFKLYLRNATTDYEGSSLEFSPHLRLMSDMSTEIVHNDEEFIPLIKLAEHAFSWNDAEKDHYILGTQVTSSAGLGFWFENNTFKVSDPDFQNSFSQIELFELLDKWHFNRFNLDEDQFINASTSKVYE